MSDLRDELLRGLRSCEKMNIGANRVNLRRCVAKSCAEHTHVYVVTAFKDGGAQGYDEWAIVGVCANLDLAIDRCRDYVAGGRPNARWWPSIEECALVRSES